MGGRMTTVRSAKSKGSQFEYDCQHSLGKIYPEIYRTSERGFQLQYDLECDEAVFECKRLKSMSWNQAKKFFEKLSNKTIMAEPRIMDRTFKTPFLLFKSNQQPCLVMYFRGSILTVQLFEDVFNTTFEKHPSTRKK